MTPLERAGHLAHSRLPSHASALARARENVADALEKCANPYVAFSTGKDSLVVLALVWEQRPQMPAVYFDADCAFPESLRLLDRMDAAGRPVLRWKCESFLDTLARMGGPDAPGIEEETMRSTVYRPAAALIARYGFDAVFMGLRAVESGGRARRSRACGAVYTAVSGILSACPIELWTYKDVWAYIVSKNLDYNREYDNMEGMPIRDRRISYWAGESCRAFGRWAWLRRNHPDLFNAYRTRFPEVVSFT